jgi:uncharacterized protein YggE
MKRWLILILLIIVIPTQTFSFSSGNRSGSQQSGNIVYSDKNNSSQARTLEGRELPTGNISISDTTVMIEANLLMNVLAEEYVATFSVSQECGIVMECNEKMDKKISDFINSLLGLGLKGDKIFVDFVAQNKIYDYEISANVAKEKQVGFEVKKNIMIYYKDKNLTDKMVTTASRFGIYDLVKVDYLVQDTAGVKKRLLEEALKLVKEKEARYSSAFGLKFRSHILIEREKYNIYFPSQMYSSYSAYETGRVISNNSKISNIVNVNSNASAAQPRIQETRKSTTFYYDPLNADGFDNVINPIINEPVVQFTLFVRVRYELDR